MINRKRMKISNRHLCNISSFSGLKIGRKNLFDELLRIIENDIISSHTFIH